MIDSDHPAVSRRAAEVAGARAPGDARVVAQRLFERARDAVRYNPFAPFHLAEHYVASRVLARGHGDCAQKAVALCALARAVGIAARLGFADIVNHRASAAMRAQLGGDRFRYHAHAELQLGGAWIAVTPVFDRRLCDERGYPLVAFDGHRPALLPARGVDGRPFVDYVAHHGTFADLPLAERLAAWEAAYGAERVATWRRTIAASRLLRG